MRLGIFAGFTLGSLEWLQGFALRLEAAPQCRAQSGDHTNYVVLEEDWVKAAREEGLDPNKVSLFGRLAPKIPRSKLKEWERDFSPRLKTIRYSFMGSVRRPVNTSQARAVVEIHQKRRMWALEFAKAKFTRQDYLSIIDVPQNWTSLGVFDHSSADRGLPTRQGRRGLSWYSRQAGRADDEAVQETEWYDRREYLRVTAKSQFVLCPGGDGSWSTRSLEVPLFGALPVIKRVEDDWRANTSMHLSRWVHQAILDRMHHISVDDLPHAAYDPRLVAENRRTAIKYMTFLEGDNEIPGLDTCTLAGKETLTPRGT